jgi:hypothetical protein
MAPTLSVVRGADERPAGGAAKVFAFFRDRFLSGELNVGDLAPKPKLLDDMRPSCGCMRTLPSATNCAEAA